MSGFPDEFDNLTSSVDGVLCEIINKMQAKIGVNNSEDTDSIDNKVANISGQAFPIGSVFISVVATNPNTLLGYGTWSAIAAGRALVGLDSGDANFDVVEETGGAKTSTPDAHSGATVSTHAAKNTDAAGVGATAYGTTASTVTLKAHVHNITQYAHTVGQAIAHAAMSIVQPYFVVYMWKRTA